MIRPYYIPLVYRNREKNWRVRFVRIKNEPWIFFNDVKYMVPDAKLEHPDDALAVHVPSRFPDKPYRSVQVITLYTAYHLLNAYPQFDSFADWLENDALVKMANTPDIVCEEFPEARKYEIEKKAGDCVTRAIAEATGMPYRKVFSDITVREMRLASVGMVKDPDNAEYYRSLEGRNAGSPDGVPYSLVRGYLMELGWQRTILDNDGKCVLFNRDAFPDTGTYIVALKNHLTCYIDGAVHDQFDCTKGGTVQILEYWTK